MDMFGLKHDKDVTIPQTLYIKYIFVWSWKHLTDSMDTFSPKKHDKEVTIWFGECLEDVIGTFSTKR